MLFLLPAGVENPAQQAHLHMQLVHVNKLWS